MDIEDEFDEYVINKIKTAMENGEKWEILSTNSFAEYEWHHFPNATGGYGRPLTRYTRQCKLGKCFIITSFIGYRDGTIFNDQPIPQVLSGNYCGEVLNQECLKEIEKLIQQYDKDEQTLKRSDRLRKIIDNNA